MFFKHALAGDDIIRISDRRHWIEIFNKNIGMIKVVNKNRNIRKIEISDKMEGKETVEKGMTKWQKKKAFCL